MTAEVTCTRCNADDLGCTACGAQGTLVAQPDAVRNAGDAALTEAVVAAARDQSLAEYRDECGSNRARWESVVERILAARPQRPEAEMPTGRVGPCQVPGCDALTAFPRCSFHTVSGIDFAEEDHLAQRPEGVTVTEALAAAERACALFGWTASRSDSDRDKAATEAWMEWARLRPQMTGREAWPDLDDEGIAALASRRDATRAATLSRIFEVSGDTEAGDPR